MFVLWPNLIPKQKKYLEPKIASPATFAAMLVVCATHRVKQAGLLEGVIHHISLGIAMALIHTIYMYMYRILLSGSLILVPFP